MRLTGVKADCLLKLFFGQLEVGLAQKESAEIVVGGIVVGRDFQSRFIVFDGRVFLALFFGVQSFVIFLHCFFGKAFVVIHGIDDVRIASGYLSVQRIRILFFAGA